MQSEPAPLGTNGHVLWRPWVAYPAVAAVVAALYLAGPLNFGPVFNLLGASAAVAIVAGTRMHRPAGRAAWYLIATGQLLFVLGDVLAYNYGRLFGGELPFPSIADPFYLAMYPCLVAGLAVFLHRRRHAGDRAGLIDAAVVAIGVGTLSWTYLMAPYVHDTSLTLGVKLTALAYPVMDVLLLGFAVRLMAGGGRRGPSGHLVAVGLLVLFVADFQYAWASLHGGYDTGELLDGAWIAFYVMLGTAALHPSMRRLSEPAGRPGAGLTRPRLALFALTALLAPGVQLVRAVLDQPPEPAIDVAACLLFLLVFARMAGLVHIQETLTEEALRRRYEARLASLVRHASDVVAILGRDGLLTYVSPSVAGLLGRSAAALTGRRLDGLVHPDDLEDVVRALRGLERGASGNVEYRVRHTDGSWRHVETRATNLEGDEAVDGIVLNTRDVSERKAFEGRLAHQAFHDVLTGLPNRELFRDRVERALTRRRRSGTRLAVLFLDLDDFKTVNDSLGHAAGDLLLQEVAARLSCCIRESDTAARLGGDEFALLLDGIADDVAALAVAERVITSLARPLVLDGQEVLTTPSVGVAFDTHGGETADELLRNADLAMYLAKDQGKGRHAVFEPVMHVAALDRLQLRAELQRAVRDGGVTLVYQPIVRVQDGEIAGVEALARWEHPARGVIPPDEFIPLAEQTGLIVPLGRALLREACLQAAALHAVCPRPVPLTMSVNLSARQLQSPELVADVGRALLEARIPASSLVLELTESAMMEDLDLATRRLEELRDLGVSLAIDDFGRGYSSLNYIRRFPVDVLKIDRSFIADIAHGPAETKALIAAIMQLAAALSLKTVAEGIEDDDQLARLRELGCTLAQGYHLFRPMPGARVEALLATAAARPVGAVR